MAKIEYRTKGKSVFLSHAEALLLLMAEWGVGIVDAFLPRKYPETHLTRRILGLDALRPSPVRLAKHRLIKRGLVVKAGAGSYRITREGQAAIEKMRELIRRRRPAWDGKWRLVVFDIPEQIKKYRDALRYALTGADYRRLQDSVWIGKQPLAGEVVELIEECQIGKHVFIFLSDAVDREEEIVRLFPGDP